MSAGKRTPRKGANPSSLTPLRVARPRSPSSDSTSSGSYVSYSSAESSPSRPSGAGAKASRVKHRAPIARDMDRLDRFDIGDQLGKGSFGVVYKVQHRATKQTYVLKTVRIDNLAEAEVAASLNEAQALSMFDNDFVVKYYSSFVEDGALHIVMEYCPGGTLFDKLRERKKAGTALSEHTIWSYFLQLCMGLHHIHSKGVLHRDMKSENVFFSGDARVRIGDLGVAKLLESAEDLTRTFVGTPYYLSPELCEGKSYNEKSDVWSLGCILYEMCTLQPPFHARNRGALMMKIVRGRFPPISSRYSRALHVLVSKLLSRSSHDRPRVQDILLDPVVRKRARKLDRSLFTALLNNLHTRTPDSDAPVSRSRDFADSYTLDNSSAEPSSELSDDEWATLVLRQGGGRDARARRRRQTPEGESSYYSESEPVTVRVIEPSTSSARGAPGAGSAARRGAAAKASRAAVVSSDSSDARPVATPKASARTSLKHSSAVKKLASSAARTPGSPRKLSGTASTSAAAAAAAAPPPGSPRRAPGTPSKAATPRAGKAAKPSSRAKPRQRSTSRAAAQVSPKRAQLARELAAHQEELHSQLEREKAACVALLGGDDELFSELFGFYKDLAKEDDALQRQREAGAITQAELDAHDRRQAKRIEEKVLGRLADDQFGAITRIYHMLYLRDEFKEGKRILYDLLGSDESEGSADSGSA